MKYVCTNMKEKPWIDNNCISVETLVVRFIWDNYCSILSWGILCFLWILFFGYFFLLFKIYSCVLVQECIHRLLRSMSPWQLLTTQNRDTHLEVSMLRPPENESQLPNISTLFLFQQVSNLPYASIKILLSRIWFENSVLILYKLNIKTIKVIYYH